MEPEKILLSWSGGKDSCLTLYEIQRTHRYQIAALLTTVTESYERISMHGVRTVLLERQAESLGLPLEKVLIPPGCGNETYECRMRQTLEKYQSQGIRRVAFGDLFLEDIRSYRETNLARIRMQGLFPLWKKDTKALSTQFVELGFQAIVVCIDPRVLDKSFAGRLVDTNFVHSLPPHVDPCGENGEFHSFVFAGPLFQRPVRFTPGEVVLRDSFWFCDLLPE